MDITTEIKNLRPALTLAKRVVARNGYGDKSVLLTAGPKGLNVAAANGSMQFNTTVPAEVRSTGSVVVGLKELDVHVKGKGTIDLTVDGDWLNAVNGVSTALRTSPVEDWHSAFGAGVVKTTTTYPIDLEAIAEVASFCGREDTRPILCGIQFSADGEIAGTDSYRLAVLRGCHSAPEMLLYSDAFLQAAKAKGDAQLVIETIERSSHEGGPELTEDQVTIVVGDNRWSVREIEGTYPNYRQLIPSSYSHSVTFGRDAFATLVRAVKPSARDSAPVRLTVTANELTVKAATQDVGQSSGSVPCMAILPALDYNGDPLTEFTLAFNPDYLLACVDTAHSDKVTLYFVDGLKPALFSEVRDNGTESIRLLMPVRVT